MIVPFPARFLNAEPLRPEFIEGVADAGFARVDALQPQFQSSVLGEKIRHLIPELVIDRVSVGVLEIRDRGLIVQPRGTFCELGDAIGKLRK